MKTPHLLALGLLLVTLSGQIDKLPNWHAALSTSFAAMFMSAIGSTLVALFSPKIGKEPEAVTLPVKVPGAE